VILTECRAIRFELYGRDDRVHDAELQIEGDLVQLLIRDEVAARGIHDYESDRIVWKPGRCDAYILEQVEEAFAIDKSARFLEEGPW
jgi:hypothetical protein